MTNELARIGCWKEVTKENYDDNCLYNAFQSAGVAEATLNAMKTQFLRRKISRKNLREIAEQHDVYIEISTDQDKNTLKYGNPQTGFPVKLALYKDHYIHLYKTKFNSFAVLHYDEVKDKGKNWWTWKSDTKRDADRGMTSINLLRTILETNHVKMIDIATEGIFKTQFYDQVSTMEFSSLEYPPKYSLPFHPPRNGKGAFTGEAQVNEEEGEEEEKTEEELDEIIDNEAEEQLRKRRVKYREIITEKDASVLNRLDDKFKELKLGLEEQAKLLAKSIPADANIFFDFEATTEESLDPKTTINACAKKILKMRNGANVIEKIEQKVMEGNLDIKARGRLYQEQCPPLDMFAATANTTKPMRMRFAVQLVQRTFWMKSVRSMEQKKASIRQASSHQLSSCWLTTSLMTFPFFGNISPDAKRLRRARRSFVDQLITIDSDRNEATTQEQLEGIAQMVI